MAKKDASRLFTIYHLLFTPMALRHPPKDVVPPAVRRRAPRVVRFEEPPEGFWRRWRRRLIRPATVIPAVVLTLVTAGLLAVPRIEDARHRVGLLRATKAAEAARRGPPCGHGTRAPA